MDDSVKLTIQERIAARRALRENGGATRQPRVEPDVLETPPTPEPQPVVEEVKPVTRTEPAEPVQLPPNVQPIANRRPIIKAGSEPVATEPTKPEPVLPTTPVVVKADELPTRDERIKNQVKDISAGLITGLLEQMRLGEQLLITRKAEGEWALNMPTAAGAYEVSMARTGTPKVERTVNTGYKAGSGRLPPKFEESLWTDAYKEWTAAWQKMSLNDKVKQAEELGVAIPDLALGNLIVNMRLSMGIQAKKQLAKYKPEYSTSEARKEAKEKALKGLEW